MWPVADSNCNWIVQISSWKKRYHLIFLLYFIHLRKYETLWIGIRSRYIKQTVHTFYTNDFYLTILAERSFALFATLSLLPFAKVLFCLKSYNFECSFKPFEYFEVTFKQYWRCLETDLKPELSRVWNFKKIISSSIFCFKTFEKCVNETSLARICKFVSFFKQNLNIKVLEYTSNAITSK